MAASKSKIAQLGADSVHPAAVVLISGPEQFLADRATRVIRDALRREFSDLEVHDIEASAYGSGELFTVASPSLFQEPRLIRVHGVEKSSDAFIQDAKTYIADPAPDTTLVLRHAGGQRGKALLDAVRGAPGAAVGAVEVPCLEIKRDQDRVQFVQSEFRRHGASVTPGAIRAMTAAYAGSLGELATALEQLVATAGLKIDEQAVDRAFEGRVEVGAFKVADAATAGRGADALVMVRQALDTGTDPIPLLAALNMKVRAMARVFGAKGSAAELARSFGMAPWQVERAQRETRGWTERDLARAVDLAAETEWALKGGSKSPGYALERYVLFIARRGRSVTHRG